MSDKPQTTQPPPAKEYPKHIKFRMRCGRIVIVLDTPHARENAKRMRWTEVR